MKEHRSFESQEESEVKAVALAAQRNTTVFVGGAANSVLLFFRARQTFPRPLPSCSCLSPCYIVTSPGSRLCHRQLFVNASSIMCQCKSILCFPFPSMMLLQLLLSSSMKYQKVHVKLNSLIILNSYRLAFGFCLQSMLTRNYRSTVGFSYL